MGFGMWLKNLFRIDYEDDSPCRVSGHNYEEAGTSGYYSHGVPHFGFGSHFRVERKDKYRCTKCGSVDFRKVTVGKVHVDKDTDELTVKQ